MSQENVEAVQRAVEAWNADDPGIAKAVREAPTGIEPV
jgi:hypothetical protein